MTKIVANATVFKNSKAIVKALKNINEVSRYLKLQLVESGHIEIVKVKKTEGRGRPSHVYQITGKGRNLLRLSQNWG